MGLLDIFRSKREEPEPEQDDIVYEIPLEDLTDWVNEQFSQDVNAGKDRIKQMISDAVSYFSETKDILLCLERADLGDSERVFTIAKMTKNSYVKHALSVIDKFSFAGLDTYSEIKSINLKIRSVLKELNKMSPKQSILVSKYFSNESSRLANNLRKINTISKEIKEFIDSDNVVESYELLNNSIEKLNPLVDRTVELNSNETETREEIKKLDVSRKEISKKKDNLLESSEWNKLKSFEDIIKNGRTELKAFESRSNEMLNGVKRPLKKLWHLQESRQSFPVNPFKEYVLDNREVNVINMIRDALRSASEGRLVLKPKESEKLQKVRDFLENEMPKIKKNYILMKEASQNARNKISQSEFYKENDSISKELNDIEQKLESKWSELNSIIQERKKTESETQELKSKIESQVLESGKKLKLII